MELCWDRAKFKCMRLQRKSRQSRINGIIHLHAIAKCRHASIPILLSNQSVKWHNHSDTTKMIANPVSGRGIKKSSLQTYVTMEFGRTGLEMDNQIFNYVRSMK